MDREFAKEYEKTLDTGQKSSSAVYLANMLIDILVGLTLQAVWDMINTL